MKKLKQSVLLPIIITIGISIGKVIALFSHYVGNEDALKRELSDISYNLYLDKWDIIRNEQKVTFEINIARMYAVKIGCYIFRSQEIKKFLEGINKVSKLPRSRAPGH